MSTLQIAETVISKMQKAYPGDGCDPFSGNPYVTVRRNSHFGADKKLIPELPDAVPLPYRVEVIDLYEPTVPGVPGCPNTIELKGWRDSLQLTDEESALVDRTSRAHL